MGRRRHRLLRLRGVLAVALLLVGLGLLLTRCPANRDGAPGQLATAMEETVSAARSGALALDLYLQGRSPTPLTSVALTDARDNVLGAYRGAAAVRAEDPVDVDRRRMLTAAMTDIIGHLNAAAAVVRQVTEEPRPEDLRDDLLADAEALEAGYR